MTLLASVRLVRQLNAWVSGAADDPAPDADLRRVAAVVTGTDVAHHVLDPDAVVGLDPLQSTPLASALSALRSRESCGWILVLPAPGRLGGLRGPAELNRAAVDVGTAVSTLR